MSFHFVTIYLKTLADYNRQQQIATEFSHRMGQSISLITTSHCRHSLYAVTVSADVCRHSSLLFHCSLKLTYMHCYKVALSYWQVSPVTWQCMTRKNHYLAQWNLVYRQECSHITQNASLTDILAVHTTAINEWSSKTTSQVLLLLGIIWLSFL
jgi:hypothetical protein